MLGRDGMHTMDSDIALLQLGLKHEPWLNHGGHGGSKWEEILIDYNKRRERVGLEAWGSVSSACNRFSTLLMKHGLPVNYSSEPNEKVLSKFYTLLSLACLLII